MPNRPTATPPTRTPPTPYLPATADRPSEPAPAILTAEEVCRLLRADAATPAAAYQACARLRREHGLRGVKVGTAVRYRLSAVLNLLEQLEEADPR